MPCIPSQPDQQGMSLTHGSLCIQMGHVAVMQQNPLAQMASPVSKWMLEEWGARLWCWA